MSYCRLHVNKVHLPLTLHGVLDFIPFFFTAHGLGLFLLIKLGTICKDQLLLQVFCFCLSLVSSLPLCLQLWTTSQIRIQPGCFMIHRKLVWALPTRIVMNHGWCHFGNHKVMEVDWGSIQIPPWPISASRGCVGVTDVSGEALKTWVYFQMTTNHKVVYKTKKFMLFYGLCNPMNQYKPPFGGIMPIPIYYLIDRICCNNSSGLIYLLFGCVLVSVLSLFPMFV